MIKKIIINDIEVEIHKKNIKNINLMILPPNGKVRISAPIRTKDEAIKKIVISKLDWIQKQIAKFEAQPEEKKKEYISGEDHYVWGKQYQMNIKHAQRNSIEIIGDKLILNVKEASTTQQRQKIMIEWYREQLKDRLPQLFEKWEKIIGVKAESVRVKDMLTRWGSCNTRDKRIWINLQLAKKPIECLEYVVVHELVHLLEKSHNMVFKGYMDEFLPDWPTTKNLLNYNKKPHH